jgi:hypothetical protein
MKLLYELYKTHSPSGKEESIIELIGSELMEMEVDFDVDEYGQIYKLIPDTPLLCAHMDQIPCAKYATVIKRNGSVISGNGNLGADDKNGIWIILKLLKEFKDKVSFLFTVCEESGGQGCIEFTKKFEEELKSIKYGLVFDRRGYNDCIGTFNEYCSHDFERDLKPVMYKYKYEPAMGVFSDCDNLADHISVVNISCGYYSSHTEKEFTVVTDLMNALHFGKSILKTITKSYSKPDKTYTYRWGRFGNYQSYNNTLFGTTETLDEEETDVLYFCSSCNEYYEYVDMYSHEKTCPICNTIVIPITVHAYKEDEDIEDEIMWKECDSCNANILTNEKTCWRCQADRPAELKCGNCNTKIFGKVERTYTVYENASAYMLCSNCKDKKCDFCDNIVEDEELIEYSTYKMCLKCNAICFKGKEEDDSTITVLGGVKLKKGDKHYPTNVFDPYRHHELPFEE